MGTITPASFAMTKKESIICRMPIHSRLAGLRVVPQNRSGVVSVMRRNRGYRDRSCNGIFFSGSEIRLKPFIPECGRC